MTLISVFQAAEFSFVEWAMLLGLIGFALTQMDRLSDTFQRACGPRGSMWVGIIFYICYIALNTLSVSGTILFARETEWRNGKWQGCMPLLVLLSISPSIMLPAKHCGNWCFKIWATTCVFFNGVIAIVVSSLAYNLDSDNPSWWIFMIYGVWAVLLSIAMGVGWVCLYPVGSDQVTEAEQIETSRQMQARANENAANEAIIFSNQREMESRPMMMQAREGYPPHSGHAIYNVPPMYNARPNAPDAAAYRHPSHYEPRDDMRGNTSY